MDIGKDIQNCLDDLNNMTHAKLAELLNLSEKTVDRMVAGKGPITKYASDLAKITGKPESWFKENITWEECGKEEVTSVHFEAKNVTEEETRFVGVWGQRHLQYLKEYRRTVYLDLMMSGRLNSYLADIEEQAQERFEIIVEQMKQVQGITEQLKVDNTWEWVGRMNNIQACAREIVDKEIIYQ